MYDRKVKKYKTKPDKIEDQRRKENDKKYP